TWPRPKRRTATLSRFRLGGAFTRARLAPRGSGRGRGRRHLLPVDPEDLLLEILPHLVVQGMSDVLERSVLALLARHRNEEALGSVDDLDVGHDEVAVEYDRDEGLELLIVHRNDLHVRDLHDVGSLPLPP